MMSCRSIEYVEVPKTVTKTEIAKDVLFITDSIYIREKPDTFYQYKERTVYKERVDTVIRCDSIVIPQVIEKEKIIVQKDRKATVILIFILILTYGAIIKKKMEKR